MGAAEKIMTEPLFGVRKSALGKEWHLASSPERTVRALVQQYQLEEPIARIIAARGYTKETAGDFLNPSLSHLPDPLVFKDMDKAIDRTIHAIKNEERIVVFGDYDVDGATSTSILRLYLRSIGVPSTYYIPDRLKEGYGPNVNAMRQLAAEGNQLCFTVDCGTTAFEPIAAARAAGMHVITCDHHAPEPQLPEANALINPVRLDENDEAKPYRNLAAVGVTFMFLCGLNRELRKQGFFSASRPEPDLRNLLGIVALGTVADVVLLTGINRVLVATGKVMAQSGANLGMNVLAQVSGLKRPMDEGAFGFQLGPRINAGGRVGESDLGVKLLCATNEADAVSLAMRLDHLNRERQAIQELMLEQAKPDAEMQAERGFPAIMVGHKDWHPGVVGIVAGRLKELYNRPAIVVGYNPHQDAYVGSGRSVRGVDLGAVVIAARQAGLIEKAGGHMMAAGVGMKIDQIGPFGSFLNERIGAALAKADTRPIQHVDAVISGAAVNLGMLTQEAKLGPYGNGNPAPRYVLQSLRLDFAGTTAKGDHVKCAFVAADGNRVEAMAWQAAGDGRGQALLSGRGQNFHVLGTLDETDFGGPRRAQLIVQDVAPA